jgi:hypothetical protein
MLDAFTKRSGKDRLEFGLMMSMILVCMLALGAILFGG